MRRALVLCCSVALLGSVGAASAQDWTKSKWGPDDEIGAANYMKPELVVKAAQLVKTGKTYALGIPVSSSTPAYPPRGFKITVVQPGQAGNPGLGPNKATYNDDMLDGWVGVGSQLDGLGHLGIEHVYYNGNKVADFADPTGLKKLGVEKIPPMVTRGVLLDMHDAGCGLRFARQRTEHVEAHHIAGAFPDRIDRRLPVMPRQNALFHVTIATEAFHRLIEKARRALADPVFDGRRQQAHVRPQSAGRRGEAAAVCGSRGRRRRPADHA